MKRITYIVLGFLFVVIGAIGTVVPLLPTTPFLLLSLFFFTRSSPKLYTWLIKNRYLGPYVQAYYSKEPIAKKVVIRTLSLLWITILISSLFFTESWSLRIFLLIMAIGVTLHIVGKYRELKK